MTTNIAAGTPSFAPPADGPLFCALTGKSIKLEEAYWAPPLITTRELLATAASTLMRSPGSIGDILFGDQPNVPYDPAVRTELAQRRSTEQAKLLFLMLLVAALIFLPVLLLAIR